VCKKKVILCFFRGASSAKIGTGPPALTTQQQLTPPPTAALRTILGTAKRTDVSRFSTFPTTMPALTCAPEGNLARPTALAPATGKHRTVPLTALLSTPRQSAAATGQSLSRTSLYLLLLGDTHGLAAPARGLCVLTTHPHAPVVPQTPVTPDLPEPVKVLTQLEVKPVRERLRTNARPSAILLLTILALATAQECMRKRWLCDVRVGGSKGFSWRGHDATAAERPN
jgi:hypothetical protein